MRVKSEKLLLACLLSLLILSGCGSGSKFASSFGKRRYTKGYFVDIPSKIPEARKNINDKPLTAGIAKQNHLITNEIHGKGSSAGVMVAKSNNSKVICGKVPNRDITITKNSDGSTVIREIHGIETNSSQTTAVNDISSANDDNTVKYTDHGIKSLFATIIWFFLLCFVWALKISVSQGLGLAFLIAMILLAIIGDMYSVLGVEHDNEIQYNV